jgi:CRP-like cAMP-binding protein
MPSDVAHPADTQSVVQLGITLISDAIGDPAQLQRLTEAIADVPPLSNLDADDLRDISEAACPVVSDVGQTIMQEGQRGKSLYIILEGSARVITHDQHGKEVELGHFYVGQVFGEISSLTGSPCTATVQALEETLLCQLSFDGMRGFLGKRPAVKQQLEMYCQGLHLEMAAKKRDAGVGERRHKPRFNVTLPVNFAVAPSYRVSGPFQWKIFNSFSQNLSLSGMRIKVQDRDVLAFPKGCPLRLEISLPEPRGTIQCRGALRHKEKPKDDKNFDFLGVEFVSLSRAMRDKLEMSLRSD